MTGVRPIHLRTVTRGVGHYARRTKVLDKNYRVILVIFPWAKQVVMNKDYGYKVLEWNEKDLTGEDEYV